jgi:hypothetical protein
MRAVTNKMVISLVGIIIAAPFFAVALIAGAHAVRLAQGLQDDVLLVALAAAGAIISMINGFGRRTAKAAGRGERQSETRNNGASKGASVITLGY